MEPGTGLTILGTAIGSAKLLEKILGPTADYLGEGLKTWTEKRITNTKRIFEVAHKRLGQKLEEPGVVSPKILKGILTDGSFCDDQLTAEYFGGVLASSRSDNERDDRGAAFIALLSRLTTYQIRTHYILYRSLKILNNGEQRTFATPEERRKLRLFIPEDVYENAMEFSEHEKMEDITSNTMFGLSREGLIEDDLPQEKVNFYRNRFKRSLQQA